MKKDEFDLPVKNVDPDENLEQRMTENAYERILPARYLEKNEDREITETPEQLFQRVAENVAEPDKKYGYYDESVEEFYEAMTRLEFMPNSPTLMNAGGELQQLSACFVLHPEDDMESIFGRVKDAAMVFKSGGGVGYPFHLLRPKGDAVGSTGGISSGPISFQRVYDTMCGTIKQGGKRRGAQMAIMKSSHPDLLRFVVEKRNEGDFSNFNISVGLTEDFMEAVKNDEDYTFINPSTGQPHIVNKFNQQFYNKDESYWPTAEGSDAGRDDNFWRDYADSIENIDQFDIELEQGEEMKLPARFIWNCMIDGAWKNGEPGLFMYDEYNKMHSYDVEEKPEYRMEATNPCGEQGLMNGEPCNLGHINLSLMVEQRSDNSSLKLEEFRENTDYQDLDKEISVFMDQALDNKRLEEVARLGTRFLDNVVTMSDFPLEEIEEAARNNRKIGLGLMGFAQMLIQLGIEYGSEESFAAAREIQKRITFYSVDESHELAKERGEFANWSDSKWSDPVEYSEWFEKYSGGMDPERFEDGLKIRNHNTTTIAPTGTTSMIGDTSGGCEPIFSLAYFKNVAKDIQGDDMLVEFDDYFLRTLEHNNVDVEAVKEEAETLMRNNEWEGIDSLPDDVLSEELKSLFVTTDQVEPSEHIRIQAAFQDYNHSGISKTCNFGHDATREDVEEAYMLAYETGCKGLTVYRDGSRDVQVMTTREDNKISDDADKEDLLEALVEKYGSLYELENSEEWRELKSECVDDECGDKTGCTVCSGGDLA